MTLYQLPPDLDPRSTLLEHFAGKVRELPIRWGWWYDQDSACIIDKDDPIVTDPDTFDGLWIEYTFADLRLYEELIIQLPTLERYSGIEKHLLEQKLVDISGRKFDVLLFDVTAFQNSDWGYLKSDWETGTQNGTFDKEAHEIERQNRIIHFTREYWFDVTSFITQTI